MSAFFGSPNYGDRRWTARWIGRTHLRTTTLPGLQEVGPTYASEPMWRISLEDILAVMSRPPEEWTVVTLKPSPLACGVCFDDLLQSDAFRIPGCGHTFCRECLRTYTVLKIHQSRYPIKCPTCSTVGGAIHSSAYCIVLTHNVLCLRQSCLDVEQGTIDKLQLSSKDLKALVQLQIAAHAVVMCCLRSVLPVDYSLRKKSSNHASNPDAWIQCMWTDEITFQIPSWPVPCLPANTRGVGIVNKR